MTEAIQRNFNLYQPDLDTLNEVAARFGSSGRRNLSAALRVILDEWRKQQGVNYDAHEIENEN